MIETIIMYLIICLSTYAKYFTQVEGLINIGTFLLWTFTIIFVLYLFADKSRLTKNNNFIIKILKRIVMPCIILIFIYFGSYFMAILWIIANIKAINEDR